MPGLGRFPCEACEYVAANRRMLARHVAINHSEKVFKCPVCPFVTRYAANWYRHKRDIHGLSRETTCDFCGFSATSQVELAQHTEVAHQDEVGYLAEKYKREHQKKVKSPTSQATTEQNFAETSPYNFYEERIPSLANPGSAPVEEDEEEVNEDSVQFSLPLNGTFLDDQFGEQFQTSSVKEAPPSSPAKMMSSHSDPSTAHLGPLKVKRSYTCASCNLQTNNPREFLYHRRDIHHERMTVHECKYCIYASRHIQKLHRHCGLVHRDKLPPETTPKTPKTPKKQQHRSPAAQAVVSSSSAHSLSLSNTTTTANVTTATFEPNISQMSVKLNEEDQIGKVLKCSACNFKTRNKILMVQHEKTMHFKKKFFKCSQCGYVTNDKARYSKHVKYHNLPKVKCNLCNFQTSYKWNMDRHMKNHINDGDYRCGKCRFTASSKQSLTVHLINHHGDVLNMSDDDEEEQFDAEMNEHEFEEEEDAEDDDLNVTSIDGKEDSANWNPDTVWKQGKVYRKYLKCRFCSYKAAWPSEMKRHEDGHKAMKKHPCPICGMRFEHLAWLAKHLMRVHHENAEAFNIASVLQMLKPKRRKSEMLSQLNNPEKSAILSALQGTSREKSLYQSLEKHPQLLMQKLTETSSSSKASSSSSLHAVLSGSTPKVADQESGMPTCDKCGYKTRWISELEKHMRVHSTEKPYECSKCNYKCKWKGDLNRHVQKYHGSKSSASTDRPKGQPSLKLKLKKIAGSGSSNSSAEWQGQEIESTAPSSVKISQDIPLDLTTCRKEGFFPESEDEDNKSNDSPEEGLYEINDMGKDHEDDYENHDSDMDEISAASRLSSRSNFQMFNKEFSGKPSRRIVMKYQCPFCSFLTRTASRFHVHIVQHYNKRPFMCSSCGYRSNWEWDVNKHIRMKMSRDKTHGDASLVLTDETGKRNYEKYKKFLVKVEVERNQKSKAKRHHNTEMQFENIEEDEIESVSKIGSYPEIENNTKTDSNLEGDPESIVVTPDISFANTNEEAASQEQQQSNTNQENVNGQNVASDVRFYRCKHCNYQNIDKKMVIGHLAVHAGVKPFRCRICGLASSWRHVIVRHVKVSHSGYMHDVEHRINYLQEGYCIRLTSVAPPSQNVSSATQSDTVFGCKICPYKCDKYFYMKFHMKHHRPRDGAIYKCTQCPYYVKFRKTLVRHMKLHGSAESSFVDELDYNNSEFNEMDSANSSPHFGIEDMDSVEDMVSRIEGDFGEGDNIYEIYDENQWKNNMKAYLPAAPRVRPKRHACEHCPYKTNNKTQYLYHKQFHRPNKNAPFKCKICSYWASLQHLLTQHMKVHNEEEERLNQNPLIEMQESGLHCDPSLSNYSGEIQRKSKSVPDQIPCIYVKHGDYITRMFQCRFCPMMNKKRANVRTHEKMHTKPSTSRFSCHLCNYKCLNQGSLTNHMKIHRNMGSDADLESFSMDFQERSTNNSSPKSEDFESVNLTRKKVFSYFCKKCPAVFKSTADLQIHKSFHGAFFPYPCPHCDYRARHKPHLHKHLLVHTPAYAAKRAASFGPESDVEPLIHESSDAIEKLIDNQTADQLQILEEAEVNAFLKTNNVSEISMKLYKCSQCPATFFKHSTLNFHLSLHGGDGKHHCNWCNYATHNALSIATHLKLHGKSQPTGKPGQRIMACPYCPATFDKLGRFERHVGLHGKKSRYTCDQCDYSVRFAANLFKHKTVHSKEAPHKKSSTDYLTVPEPTSNAQLSSATVTSHIISEKSKESAKSESSEEKKIFLCDRCPYTQTRKDAVQSHQRRHSSKDGMKCPHCDYSSLQTSFLRDHIRWHTQPQQLFKAEAYMMCKMPEIWVKEDEHNTSELIFKDTGIETMPCNRFVSPLIDNASIKLTSSVPDCKNETNGEVPNKIIDSNSAQSLMPGSSNSLAKDNEVASASNDKKLTDSLKVFCDYESTKSSENLKDIKPSIGIIEYLDKFQRSNASLKHKTSGTLRDSTSHHASSQDMLDECDSVSDETIPVEDEYQEEESSALEATDIPQNSFVNSIENSTSNYGAIGNVNSVPKEYFETEQEIYPEEPDPPPVTTEIATSSAGIEDMDWKSNLNEQDEVLADVMMSKVYEDNGIDGDEDMLSQNTGIPCVDDVAFIEPTTLGGCHSTTLVPEHENPLPEVEIQL